MYHNRCYETSNACCAVVVLVGMASLLPSALHIWKSEVIPLRSMAGHAGDPGGGWCSSLVELMARKGFCLPICS